MKPALPKQKILRRPPVRKRSGGATIANGDKVADLAGKFNIISDSSPDETRLPGDLDGGGGYSGDGGGSGYTPGLGCAMFTRTSSVDYSGGRRLEVFKVGPVVDVGFKYTLMVYSHGVEVKAAAGDSPTSIAAKMASAVNNTTAAQWNDAGGAAAAMGKPGFKPTASSSGDQVSVILNWQNSFASWAEGCNNTAPPPPPPPPPPIDPGDHEEPPPPPPSNQAPVAVAGEAITVQLPQDSVQLNGSGSYDPETGPLEFSWVMVDGPNMPTITGAATATPTISNLVPGYYSFRLTVFDPLGASSSSTVNLTVVAAAAPPPPDNNVPGPSPVKDTAPVLTQYFGPFGPLGGGAGANAKPALAQPPAPTKKIDWLLWAFVGLSVTYVVFAPNK